MSEALSPADRSTLAAEQGPVNMAVGGVLLFDAHPGLAREAIVGRLTERLHLAPRLRQRLQAPALGLANPVWADDRDFDPDWHVRHTSLSPPGDDEQLGALVARELSRRLDRSRPLWEITVVDGLSGGRGAVLVKLHHALVDGMAALALGMTLLDPAPEPLPVPPADAEWTPEPFALRGYVARLAATPLGQAQRMMVDGLGRALAPDPRRAAGDVRRATELLAELARNRPQAPMTPLNRVISSNRDFAFVSAALADVKRAARAAQATVNDVVLTAVTGMLRRYLDHSDGSARPVALVPVSVRRRDERGELGNRISTVLVELPVSVQDPGQRLVAVRERMDALKESTAVRAGALMVGAAGAAPPLVSAMLARALSGVRAFNLVVSNVPGPQQPLYLNGARVLECYPAVPLNPANQGLSVGILSYDGGVFFGLLADRALDPPLTMATTGLRASLDELLAG
jgi:WS/DGAT/MGAT family acyltransferase